MSPIKKYCFYHRFILSQIYFLGNYWYNYCKYVILVTLDQSVIKYEKISGGGDSENRRVETLCDNVDLLEFTDINNTVSIKLRLKKDDKTVDLQTAVTPRQRGNL